MASPADLLAAGLGGRPDPLPDAADLAALLPAYEVGPLIGRGAMGAVYRARHRDLDRTVALKVLLFHTQPAAVARFRTEARALARLDHPHIVRIFDVGESDGLCWLAMEFIDGTDLRRAMAERRLAPADILALVPQVCAALQYAHDQGVVHRDIKPENLLIDRAGQVHIADFGLAQLTDPGGDGQRLTAIGATMGTPHYMAPEQVEHPQTVDHRADLYALGVVFYEMLTGELPLGRFPPPSCKVTVDVRIDEVVLRALEKEPERRYQQARQFGSRVEQIRTQMPRRWWPVAIPLIIGAGCLWWWAHPAPAPSPAHPSSDISTPATSALATSDLVAQALIDAGLLRDERFTALSDRFTPAWRRIMDDVDCASRWRGLAADGGIFLGFGAPAVAGRTVRMDARWQSQARELVITYDAQDRIAGLWLHPLSH